MSGLSKLCFQLVYLLLVDHLTQVPSFELDAPPTGFTKLDFEISESMDAQRNLF